MQYETTNGGWGVQAGIGAGIIAVVGTGLWAVWYLNDVNTSTAVVEEAAIAELLDESAAIEDEPVAEAPVKYTPEQWRAARQRNIDKQLVRAKQLLVPGIEFLDARMDMVARTSDGALYRVTLGFNNAAESNGLITSGYVFRTDRFVFRVWDGERQPIRSVSLEHKILRRVGETSLQFDLRLTNKQQGELVDWGLVDKHR